jgi:hypothetical protein
VFVLSFRHRRVRHRVISQAFVGHIGATELAAYALVSTTVLMRFSDGILVSARSLLVLLLSLIRLSFSPFFFSVAKNLFHSST